ncbi:MAG: tyrosine-type recombinase/integrase [Desulfobulbaceae bacterium]|nr:tyrosine-type recombinase/integrase [Desulfobulbaceae bacterium]
MSDSHGSSDLLEGAINDYLMWMIENEYTTETSNYYGRILGHFKEFVVREKIAWEHVFTPDTLEAFLKVSKSSYKKTPIKGIGHYLFKHGRITQPLWKKQRVLPEIYEEYLVYFDKVRQVNPSRIQKTKRLLTALHDYLEKNKWELTGLRIKQIDSFLAQFNHGHATSTQAFNRSLLRGFLSYLYIERRMLQRDLALLIVGATQFAQAKPPRFLRPHEVQQLFTTIEPVTSFELRTYAMLHLAYALGLRPCEISRITLDDLSFRQGEISLPQRKACNPIKLPLPENTIKSIAAYLVGGRPKSSSRTLFLRHKAPIRPVTAAGVSRYLQVWFKRTGINASAYWLRHTYAQNLLEAGVSVFEIKEMLGHDRIQTSKRYIHIHTKLMRKVLFDETL